MQRWYVVLEALQGTFCCQLEHYTRGGSLWPHVQCLCQHGSKGVAMANAGRQRFLGQDGGGCMQLCSFVLC